jgi:hypothetical protein
MFGGVAPHICEGFPGPPGPARPQKRTQTNPARLPPGTQRGWGRSVIGGLVFEAGIGSPPRACKCKAAASQASSGANIRSRLCYAMMLPSRKSGFRAGFQLDSSRGSFKIGPPIGLISGYVRASGDDLGPALAGNLARTDQNPVQPARGPEALLSNLKYPGQSKPALLEPGLRLPETLVEPGLGLPETFESGLQAPL